MYISRLLSPLILLLGTSVHLGELFLGLTEGKNQEIFIIDTFFTKRLQIPEDVMALSVSIQKPESVYQGRIRRGTMDPCTATFSFRTQRSSYWKSMFHNQL